MNSEREAAAPAALPDPLDLRTASLRARLSDLRLEVLRLRASRRTLMALVEMEGRQRAALECEVSRLRLLVRAGRLARRQRERGGGEV